MDNVWEKVLRCEPIRSVFKRMRLVLCLFSSILFWSNFTSNFLVIFKLCTSHFSLEGDLWTTCINLVFTPLGIIVEVFSFLGYMCPKIMTRCNLIWMLVCVSYISFCFQNLDLTYSVEYPESVGEAHSLGFHLA